MYRFRFALSALMIIVCPFAVRGEKLSREELKAFGTIRPMDPYEYCRKIASPEFAGRLTGDEGYANAAKWAASKF